MDLILIYTKIMVRYWLLKILLAPISLLYGIGVSIRNFLYDSKAMKPVKFSVPIISVGNLSVGGSGKTPHVEYLLRYLKQYMPIATMSRGYRRKSKGFKMVEYNSHVEEAGDEPLQFKKKYPDVAVAVSESRALGIPSLLGNAPQTQCIILDDAFQHRAVQPYINILLTTHSNPYFRDFMMPSGRLREWPSAADRADIIMVSKCHEDMSHEDRKKWVELIEPKDHQRIFFTYYKYYNPYSLYKNSHSVSLDQVESVVLLSALASTEYLEEYVEARVENVINMPFNDHHYFTKFDIGQAIGHWKRLPGKSKMILTTEKDAMRLIPHIKELHKNQVPVYVLPINVSFLFNEEQVFQSLIKDKLLKFKS